MVKGDGVRVTDGEGNVWIDAHGGYASVNAGYGQTAIADAMLGADAEADILSAGHDDRSADSACGEAGRTRA